MRRSRSVPRRPVHTVRDLLKQAPLLVPVDAADDGPQVSLVEALDERQKQDLFLNFWSQIGPDRTWSRFGEQGNLFDAYPPPARKPRSGAFTGREELDMSLCRVLHFHRQALAESGKCCFDVVQARMVVEVKQPVYCRFRYPEPACQFHFLEAGCLKCQV